MHRELTRATRLGVCLCLCSMGVWAFNFPGTRIAAPTALASGYYGTVTGNIGISVTVSTQPGETFGASYAALSVVTITPQPSGVPVVLPSARNGWQTPNFKSYIQGSDLPAGTTSVGISVKLVSSLYPAGQVVPTSGTHTILIDNDSPVTGTVKRIGVERYDINSTMRTDDYYNADFYGNPTPAVPLAGSPFRYTQSAYDDQDNTVALYSGSFADLRDANPAELAATPSVRFYRLTDSAALPTVYVCSTSIPIFLRDAASFSGADIHDPGYPAGVIANPGVPADVDGGDTAFDALSGNHNKTQFRVETDQMKPYEYTKAGYFARFGRQWEWQKEQLSESTYPVSTSLTQGNGYYWIHWRTFDANVANLNRTNIYHFGPILVYQEGPELTCDIDRGTVSCDQAYPSLITTGAQYISLLADPAHPESCIHSRTPETVSDVEVVEMVRTTGVSTWLGGLPLADPRYRADMVRTNPGCINGVLATVTRFYFLADRCGNGDFFSETFTVTDKTRPVLVGCPTQPLQLECGGPANGSSITAWLAGVTATDTCGAATVTNDYVLGRFSDGCGNTGSQVVTWTATDACGLTATCSQTITIQDTTKPVLVGCPAQPLVLECGDPANASLTTAWLAGVTATDTCGTATVTNDYALGRFSDLCGNTGSQVVTWTATDACGLTTTCSQTITIQDTTKPVLVGCPTQALVLECGDQANGSLIAAWLAGVTATDTCGTATVANDYALNRFSDLCGNTGSQVVTWTATDACGLTATCSQTITILDTTKPVIRCPYNISVPTDDGECSAAVSFEATALDNCDQQVIAVIYYLNYGLAGQAVITSPHTFPLGVTTVTAVATDACGLTDTCSFTVTVTETVKLSVGTGYTILYPNGTHPLPNTPPTSTPYELAGPGNWVTVPISVANPCSDLAQLVFEITFPAHYYYDEGCFRSTNGRGLRYMVGTERWDPKRVNPATVWNDWAWTHGTTTTNPLAGETRVQVEYGVGLDPSDTGRLVVYMDSPTGEAVVNKGEGVFMWLMFRVSDDDAAGFDTLPLTASVVYATNLEGIEIASQANPGVVYVDRCNWLLDVDRNGRVDPETDGVTLYRALKYAHLNDAQSCSTVPILPPDYAAAAGEYLPTDADIVSGVQSGLLGMFDLNVDGLNDASVNGNSSAIGFPGVSASRDGVYIYRNLAGNPTFIYPPYAGTGPFTPFVSPSVPVLAGVTVPSTHGVSGAAETAINVKIDVLKILGCPWLWAVPKLSIDLPLNPPPSLPCWWLVPVGEGVKTLPLPQPESSWDCSPPITGG